MQEILEGILLHNADDAVQVLRRLLLAYGTRKQFPRDLLEEAIQDLLLDLAQYTSQFLGADNPGAYVYASFFRRVLRIVETREENNESSWDIGDGEGLEDFRTPTPPQAAMIAENRQRFQRKMGGLIPNHEEIMRMRVFEHASYEDIGVQVGMDPKVVRGTYSKLTRRMLAELGIEDLE